MKKETLTIKNKLGLHTRASAKLVDVAKQFTCRIELIFRDRVVDCKSIMGVITLGAQKDHAIEVIANGEGEEDAVKAIGKLINAKFGEE